MKKIFSFLLTVVIFVLMTILIGITVIQQELDLRPKLSLFQIEMVKAKDMNYDNLLNMETLTPNLLHKYLDEEFERRGIPTEVLDYILKEGDYQQMFDEYKQEWIRYFSNNSETPQLPIEKIHEMIEKGIETYNQDTNHNLDAEKVKKQINHVTEQIENKIKKIKDNRIVGKILHILFDKNSTIYLICGIILASILILIINGFSKAIMYLSISTMLSGIACICCHFILNLQQLHSVKELLGIQYQNISSTLMVYGFITTAIGIVLLVIPAINHYTKKENSIHD